MSAMLITDTVVFLAEEQIKPLPELFAGPKNGFMDVLRAFGSLVVIWFIFRQLLTSFTIARMISAGVVAGFCVWLVNGGLLVIIGMIGDELAPLGTPDTWFWD